MGSAVSAGVLTVQYLRGVAATLVVILHVYGPERFVYGYFGVDVFFVISGYIMWRTAGARDMPPTRFILQRVRRIAPLYWLMTLFSAFVVTSPHIAVNFDIDYNWLAHSLFFVAGDGRERWIGIPYPILGPGWTLNYEMFFYLLFAFALAAPRSARLETALAPIALLAVIGLFVGANPHVQLRFYTSSIIAEFAFGVFLGWLHLERPALFEQSGRAFLVLAAGFLGPLLFWRLTGWKDRGFLIGFAAFLAVAGALSFERATQLRPSRAMKLLGDASYSIYLTHWPALAAIRKVFRFPPAEDVSVLEGSCQIPAALAIGIAVYCLIERPIDKFLRAQARKAATI